MKVKPATTTVAEMRDEPRWKRTADTVNAAADRVIARGAGFGGKAFISDVASEVGMPLERLAPLLLRFRQAGWVELDRADLVAALDPAKVKASELDDGIGRVHFIVPPRRNPATDYTFEEAALTMRAKTPLDWTKVMDIWWPLIDALVDANIDYVDPNKKAASKFVRETPGIYYSRTGDAPADTYLITLPNRPSEHWVIAEDALDPAVVIDHELVPVGKAWAVFAVQASTELGIPLELVDGPAVGPGARAVVLFLNPRKIWQLSYFEFAVGPTGHLEGKDPVPLVDEAYKWRYRNWIRGAADAMVDAMPRDNPARARRNPARPPARAGIDMNDIPDRVWNVIAPEWDSIVDRALAAGARPPLEYKGAGMTSVVLCELNAMPGRGTARAFKVGRQPAMVDGKPSTTFHTLSEEAEWLEAAKRTPGVARHVAGIQNFDRKNNVIIRTCANGRAGRWADEDRLRTLHELIDREMRKHGWTAPEFKGDSYVIDQFDVPVLVDASMPSRVGAVLVEYVREVLRGERPRASYEDNENLAFHIRAERDNGTIPPDVAEAVLEELRVPANNRIEWKENPAWLNRALAKNFDALASQFPPEWQPKIKSPKTNSKGEVVVNFRELGCGAYGCVLETFDPDVVIKVTTDESESEFVQMAAQWGWPAGITKYYGYETLLGKYRLSRRRTPRTAALLYRESATDVGRLGSDEALGIDQITGRRARADAAVLAQSIWDSGERLLKTMEAWRVDGGELPALFTAAERKRSNAKIILRGMDPLDDKFWGELNLDLKDKGNPDDLAVALALEAYTVCMHAMVANAALGTVGKTLLFYAARGLVFADLHQGNFGVCQRDGRPTWVITDPGNIVVLKEPW